MRNAAALDAVEAERDEARAEVLRVVAQTLGPHLDALHQLETLLASFKPQHDGGVVEEFFARFCLPLDGDVKEAPAGDGEVEPANEPGPAAAAV